jgi:hypothetical protein
VLCGGAIRRGLGHGTSQHALADQGRAGDGFRAASFIRGSGGLRENDVSFQRGHSEIKSLVVAAALSIGLAGYAFAQNTITGAPAGTAPETPASGTPLPIPGVTPAPTGSHSSQMRHRANTSRERARASAHHMHHMRHNPAPKPAT